MPRSVRFAVTTLLVVSCIQLAFSRTALCAEPLDPERLLKEALSQEALDPRQILSALLGEAGTFQSNGTDGSELSIEMLELDKAGAEVRLIEDVSASGFRSLAFPTPTSFILRHDQDVLALEAKTWTIGADDGVRMNWEATSSRKAVATQTSRIDVSIAGMMSNVTDWPSVEYNPSLSELQAKNSTGETLVVRLRTPDDSERHGSLISHASVWNAGRRIRELRCCARGQSDLHLPQWSRQQFEVCQHKVSISSRVKPPGKRMRFNDWFQHGDKIGPVKTNDSGWSLELIFGTCSATRLGNGYTSELTSQADSEAESHVLEGSDFIRSCISTMLMKADLEHSLEFDAPLNDDTAVAWRRIERISTFSLLNLCIPNLVDMLADREIAPEDRARHAGTAGLIGRPVSLSHQVKDTPHHDLLEAILWSHWQYPCSTKHVHTCLDLLQESVDPDIQSEAIDSLICLNQLDHVSLEHFSTWWDRRVTNTGIDILLVKEDKGEARRNLMQRAIIDFRRWRTIWTMSRYPTGRQILRDRLDSNDPLVVRQLALRALRLRADSAIRNQRYDFMSRSECEACLAIPEIEFGGRDLSSGKARPFPVDDQSSN